MSPEEHAANGDSLFVDGSYSEAVEAYTSAIEGEPTKAAFRVKRAAAHLKAGSPVDAVADASRCAQPATPPDRLADCFLSGRVGPNFRFSPSRDGFISRPSRISVVKSRCGLSHITRLSRHRST